MIKLITGTPLSGKTCSAIEMALLQNKPVYTNIIDNTADSSFLPKSFKSIPDCDWTLINEPAFIIYDACEHIEHFRMNFTGVDHRIEKLMLHKQFGHDIIFIFLKEEFAHKKIRMLAELMHIDAHFNGRRSFGV